MEQDRLQSDKSLKKRQEGEYGTGEDINRDVDDTTKKTTDFNKNKDTTTKDTNIGTIGQDRNWNQQNTIQRQGDIWGQTESSNLGGENTYGTQGTKGTTGTTFGGLDKDRNWSQGTQDTSSRQNFQGQSFGQQDKRSTGIGQDQWGSNQNQFSQGTSNLGQGTQGFSGLGSQWGQQGLSSQQGLGQQGFGQGFGGSFGGQGLQSGLGQGFSGQGFGQSGFGSQGLSNLYGGQSSLYGQGGFGGLGMQSGLGMYGNQGLYGGQGLSGFGSFGSQGLMGQNPFIQGTQGFSQFRQPMMGYGYGGLQGFWQ